jgi:hypothetical protein
MLLSIILTFLSQVSCDGSKFRNRLKLDSCIIQSSEPKFTPFLILCKDGLGKELKCAKGDKETDERVTFSVIVTKADKPSCPGAEALYSAVNDFFDEMRMEKEEKAKKDVAEMEADRKQKHVEWKELNAAAEDAVKAKDAGRYLFLERHSNSADPKLRFKGISAKRLFEYEDLKKKQHMGHMDITEAYKAIGLSKMYVGTLADAEKKVKLTVREISLALHPDKQKSQSDKVYSARAFAIINEFKEELIMDVEESLANAK